VAAFTLTSSATIEAPAAAVWATVADYDRDPEWRSGVTTMAPKPPGVVAVGTTTAEVLRFGGRTYRNDGEVTAVDPGRHFAWRTTSGADAAGSRTVRALDDDRCVVTLQLTVRPHGIERLLRPVLARMLQRGMATDLGRLATLVTSARLPTG
jgi:uncharacterized protein YndB with AHSA1/START domain